jgi:hypothetical protein
MRFEETLEERLDEVAPLQDIVGNIAEEARYEQNRTLKFASLLMGGLLATSVICNVVQAGRPPIIRWIRINSIGEAAPIQYSDLNYTPQDSEIRHFLDSWAHLRYSRMRNSIVKNNRNSYYFIEGNYAGLLQRQEQVSHEIVDVVRGALPESDVNVKHVQITTRNKMLIKGSVLSGGQADIDLERVYSTDGTNGGRKEQERVSVTFFLNPDSVERMSRRYPDYPIINPLGLVITEIHESGVGPS